jgi:hypothetical protein
MVYTINIICERAIKSIWRESSNLNKQHSDELKFEGVWSGKWKLKFVTTNEWSNTRRNFVNNE